MSLPPLFFKLDGMLTEIKSSIYALGFVTVFQAFKVLLKNILDSYSYIFNKILMDSLKHLNPHPLNCQNPLSMQNNKSFLSLHPPK